MTYEQATTERPKRLPAGGMVALLSSLFLVDLGSAMTGVALPLLLIQRYGFSLTVGLTLAIRVVPSILVGPVVGSMIGRLDPRRLAVTSALGAAALVGVIPLTNALWQVQLLGLALGVTGMFAGPARLVLRPRVIKEGDELRGNGFLVAAELTPALVGPALVAVLVAAHDVQLAFYCEAVANAVAAVLILRVPRTPAPQELPAHEPPTPAPTKADRPRTPRRALHQLLTAYTVNTRTLVRATTEDRYLLGLTITAFTYVAAVAVGRFVLLRLGEDKFHDIPGFYGYLVGAMAVGGIVGGLFAGRLSRFSSGRIYILGNVLEAVVWVAVVYVPPTAAVVLLCVAGILESTATAVFFAEVQVRIRPDAMGYYYAALIPFTDACGFAGTSVGAVVANWSTAAGALCTAGLMAVPILLTARWYFTPAPARRAEAPA
jgi:MFS family permease